MPIGAGRKKFIMDRAVYYKEYYRRNKEDYKKREDYKKQEHMRKNYYFEYYRDWVQHETIK
jgi:hypothetical protein